MCDNDFVDNDVKVSEHCDHHRIIHKLDKFNLKTKVMSNGLENLWALLSIISLVLLTTSNF